MTRTTDIRSLGDSSDGVDLPILDIEHAGNTDLDKFLDQADQAIENVMGKMTAIQVAEILNRIERAIMLAGKTIGDEQRERIQNIIDDFLEKTPGQIAIQFIGQQIRINQILARTMAMQAVGYPSDRLAGKRKKVTE